MKIVILLLGIIWSSLYSQTIDNAVILSKTSLQIPDSLSFNRPVFKLSKDKSRIMLFELYGNTIYLFHGNGQYQNRIKLKSKAHSISDADFDKQGEIYIIDDKAKCIEIYDQSLNYKTLFSCNIGDKIFIENSNVYTLKTFFLPGQTFNKNISLRFNKLGKILQTMGKPPRCTFVGYMPAAGGNIDVKNQKVILSNSFNYTVDIYSIDGKKIKTFMTKPKFYYRIEKFLKMDKETLSKWYKTTLLYKSVFYKEKYVLSNYCNVGKTHSWLVIMGENYFREIEIDRNMRLLSADGNIIYFLYKTSSNKKNKYEILKLKLVE